MKILLIKLSSLGDIIHTLPAISDIKKNLPNVEITWAIEPNFAEVAAWHPAVSKIIHIPLRQIKKRPWSLSNIKKLYLIIRKIRATQYDLVIDAQGLLKSAFIAKIAKANTAGFCHNSAREAISAKLYKTKITVDNKLHAIERTRILCSKILRYPTNGQCNYGLKNHAVRTKYIMIFHSTTWENKHYPEYNWQQLIKIINQAGYSVYLPALGTTEISRATRLISNSCNNKILANHSLSEIKNIISKASAAVGLDTGLSHLAAATATPCVAIYGPTDPILAGNRGKAQISITSNSSCAPCMKRQCSLADNSILCMQQVTATQVWGELKKLLNHSSGKSALN